MAKIRLKISKNKNKKRSRKATGKKKSAAREKEKDLDGFDFSDIEEFIRGRTESGDAVPPGGVEEEQREGVEEKLMLLGDKIDRHDTEIASIKSTLESLNEKLLEIESNIRKLLDIYELVIKEINPFVEPGTGVRKQDYSLPEDIDIVRPEGGVERSKKEGMKREEESVEEFKEITREDFAALPPPTPKKGGELNQTLKGAELMERLKQGKPILEHLPMDYRTMILVFRWVEFLFERVAREKIGMILEYYKDIGWISEEVKSKVMAFARGEVQDPTKYEPAGGEPGPEFFDKGEPPMYKRANDWRLSADDHLKSLLFILKIIGSDVNKDIFNAIEQEIKTFKQNLEEYYGV